MEANKGGSPVIAFIVFCFQTIQSSIWGLQRIGFVRRV